MSAAPELLRAVVDHIDSAVLALDAAFRVVLYNRGFVEMWGFAPELLDHHPSLAELIRLACSRGLYPEGSAQELAEQRLRLMREDRSHHVIVTPRTDGREIEVHTARLPDGSYVLTYRDLTEQRRIERELRHQMEFTEQLIASSASATFVLDPSHRVLFWNRACEELTGVAAGEVLGTDRAWQAFYSAPRPCLADLVLEGTAHRMPELYPFHGPSRLARDGLHAEGWYENLGDHRRYIVFDAAPIRSPAGKLLGAVETLQDMTQLKLAEEEVARLAQAVEQAAEAVVITDTSGRILYANPALETITGRSRDSVGGADLIDILAPDDPAQVRGDLFRSLNQGKAWRARLLHVDPDGCERRSKCSISPLRDEAGAILNWVGLLHDVTRQVEMEQQLAVSQKLQAIGTLTGGIAHDFNNLLMTILGGTELASLALDPGSPEAENLERVVRAAEQARDLVRQILEFSRQESHSKRPLAAQPLVEEALQFLRVSIPSHVELITHLDAPDVLVYASPSNVQQIVVNLCSNGIQAIGLNPGRLTVQLGTVQSSADQGTGPSGSSSGRYACLTISDTGCGMEPSLLNRIFDPFFTTKEVDEGTGLGLSVVHGSVTACGGTISVRSRLGEGATFEVYLPVYEGELTAEQHKLETPQKHTSGSVLMVDDDPLLLDMGRDMLTSLGVRARVAADGVSALRMLREEPLPDLVLTDLSMPHMTGLQLAAAIHSDHPDLPVVLCTGFSDTLSELDAQRYGVRGILYKPVRRSELEEAIGAHLTHAKGGESWPAS